MSPRARAVDPDELAALEEERDFLVRSLDDLEREHEAGDVDDVDYQALKDDYTARAAATLRAIDDGKRMAVPGPPARGPMKTYGIAAAIVLVAVLTGIVMAQASGRRDAGDSLTGDIDVSVRTQVRDCIASETTATDPIDVLECYDGVLELDPANVQALTYRGWFLARTAFQAGDQGAELLDSAAAFLDEAIAVDPGFADAHVFRAVIHDRQGESAEALARLDAFDALDAPADAQQLADGLRARLEGD